MSTVSVATFVDFADKAINIDQWGADHVDRSNWIGMAHSYSGPLYGPVADNSPIDVILWSLSGTMAPSGMEHWQTCLNLMVHS